MSKPMTWSKPASAAVFAIPTIPPAGPDRIASLPRNRPASVSPPLDCMKNRRPAPLRPATTLSPGERTRAALALLQGRGVNLLVLDEPTNHLDLAAIEQLESALDSYDGTLLLVTHDRRMLGAVRTTRRLDVREGSVTER